MPMVQQHDSDGAYLSGAVVDIRLAADNKGLEGLTCLHRGGQTYLLGLSEGNHRKGGEAGRRPGGGRIHDFSFGQEVWQHVGVIRLPKDVPFEDYASVAVAGDRLAVVSQESSEVWIGTISLLGFDITDDGMIFGFPRDEDGHKVYCNVEGICWVGNQLVCVSDKAKKDEHERRCRDKDQSIHLVNVPLPDAEDPQRQ
jgi:hypothetical protein